MNKNYDRLLSIKTKNKGSFVNQSSKYKPYEATPYSLLHTLFTNYPLKKTDVFVDFGSGKGRLLFYVHYLFGAKVVGVEKDIHLYEKTLNNKKNYLQKFNVNSSFINIHYCLAEQYEIKAKENKFYFFNPFSEEIFQKVINNIVKSVQTYPRTVDLILYYPHDNYIKYLKTTAFQCIQKVKVPGLSKINKNERFLIFRFEEK